MTSKTRAGGLSTRRQVAEVVSGNTARNVRELAAHLLAVTVGERLESGVDFGAASAFSNEAVEIFRAGCADMQTLAKQWREDKRFAPQMPAQRREALLGRWRAAVERSRGWACE